MSTELSRRVKVLSTVGIMLALLLAALDQTIVGTALPRIVAELNGLDRYSWLITGYLVSSTVIVPIAGKLGDLFGRKPFLMAGMVGFVGASALAGLSQDMNQLIIFRIIQGLFGGLLFASAFTVLADIFPPQQRAKMQGLFGGVFGLASIVGPVVGGFLTDNLGWRWVFYVNLPVGLLGVVMVAGFLPFVRTTASWRDIDFWGSGALAAGLIPLLVALSLAGQQGWGSAEVLGLMALGLVMLVVFFLVEQRVKEPIVPFRLFKNRVFAVSMIVGFLSALGMFGMIIFIPLELQGVLGASVTNSGLLLTPMMGGLIVASILSGQLMVRIKRYHFLGTAGLVLVMAGIPARRRHGGSVARLALPQTTAPSDRRQATAQLAAGGLHPGDSLGNEPSGHHTGRGRGRLRRIARLGALPANQPARPILEPKLPGQAHHAGQLGPYADQHRDRDGGEPGPRCAGCQRFPGNGRWLF
jgi:EmrB/QacA subfamily drug resistance transporter